MMNKINSEGFAPVTGGKVWYRVVGAEKKGVPLLTLHGGPGASHGYMTSLDVFSEERPVVFFDQLGCGRSDNPKDESLWTIERYAEELGQVRDFLGLGRTHILGHSWGAMIAAKYMLSHDPKGVASLVLSAPCLSASRWYRDQREYLARMPDAIRAVIEEKEASGDYASPAYQDAMMTYYRKHVCRLDPWPDYIVEAFAGINMDLYKHMWGPSEFTVTGTLKSYEVVGALGGIRVPTLFTAGRFDEASPAAVEDYRGRLPGAELVVFEDAAHLHFVEKGAEYAAAVREFLRKAEEKG